MRFVILGGGVAGHTAATFAAKWLGSEHEVVVVTPNSQWNWIPSNIWVGVGKMQKSDVVFDLAPVYKKGGVIYKQALATEIHPEGGAASAKPYITMEYTSQDRAGQVDTLEYDYLLNATGPKLNFGATPGLDPEKDGNTVSVCSAEHAVHASSELDKIIEALKKGEHKTILVGMGHGMCTCQGAAFEYIFNIETKLTELGLRDRAKIVWISNEFTLGDFGMGYMHINRGGYRTSSQVFAESIFAEKGLFWITGAHVNKVEKDRVHYETLDGEMHEQEYDFAMLIPPFSGVGLKAYNKAGEDITDVVFAPNGFMKVDADYTPKAFEDWKASDWPETLQNPTYPNMFAAGIAFAPPHPISKPMKSKNGTPISPTPPRTGMPAGIMGKATAQSICDMINGKSDKPTHTASMSDMGAACVASVGKNFFSGAAVAMTVYPVVPDYERFPETGRDQELTFGEVGLAGHWIKHVLHHMFIYKAKLKPGWTLIPE